MASFMYSTPSWLHLMATCSGQGGGKPTRLGRGANSAAGRGHNASATQTSRLAK